MKLITYILTLLVLITSCDTNPKTEMDEGLIMSIIIDRFAVPFVQPPLADAPIDTIVPKRIRDSIKNITLNVIIHPRMGNSVNEVSDGGIPLEFENLFKSELPEKEIFDLGNIKSKKGHRITLVNSDTLSKPMSFLGYDQLFNFSRIWYNDNKTLAVVEVGISRGKLNGYAQIVCLKKESDLWNIVHVKQTTMW